MTVTIQAILEMHALLVDLANYTEALDDGSLLFVSTRSGLNVHNFVGARVLVGCARAELTSASLTDRGTLVDLVALRLVLLPQNRLHR